MTDTACGINASISPLSLVFAAFFRTVLRAERALRLRSRALRFCRSLLWDDFSVGNSYLLRALEGGSGHFRFHQISKQKM